jgi:hypothetical protein
MDAPDSGGCVQAAFYKQKYGEAQLSDKPASGSGFLIVMLGLALASSFVVLFGLRQLSQKSGGDGFDSTNGFLQVEQSVTITAIRKATVEDFADTVIRCIPSKSFRDQILTTQELLDRINTVIENFSVLDTNNSDKCGKSQNRAWTFTSPCKLTINKAPVWFSGAIKLGDVNLCETTMAESIHSAMGHCTASSDFPGCFVNSVLANVDVQREFDKP